LRLTPTPTRRYVHTPVRFGSLALPSGLELLSHHPDIGRRK
jgi:hypothetical protein